MNDHEIVDETLGVMGRHSRTTVWDGGSRIEDMGPLYKRRAGRYHRSTTFTFDAAGRLIQTRPFWRGLILLVRLMWRDDRLMR